jgi:hypothetical protein
MTPVCMVLVNIASQGQTLNLHWTVGFNIKPPTKIKPQHHLGQGCRSSS